MPNPSPTPIPSSQEKLLTLRQRADKTAANKRKKTKGKGGRLGSGFRNMASRFNQRRKCYVLRDLRFVYKAIYQKKTFGAKIQVRTCFLLVFFLNLVQHPPQFGHWTDRHHNKHDFSLCASQHVCVTNPPWSTLNCCNQDILSNVGASGS